MKKPRQISMFPAKSTTALTQQDIARIILAKGESRYTGDGSLMTRWAEMVVAK